MELIFGILIIIPYNQIFICNFIGIKESEIKGDQTYEDFNFTFYNDYEKINPMTKKEAIKNFLGNLLSNGLISKEEYNQIYQNIDKVNLLETYYKARKNFSDSLLLKVFMNMPELDNKRQNKQRKSFLTKLKEQSKNKNITFFNLILSSINQNYNANNGNDGQINDIENNNDENLINTAKPKSSRKKVNNKNELTNFSNTINGNIKNVNTNQIGNNININININISNSDEHEKDTTKKRKSLSKKNMEIFKHLVKTEQSKILSYYKNPVLFSIKKLCEGIIFNNDNNYEEDKKEIDKLSKINEDIYSINESNANTDRKSVV